MQYAKRVVGRRMYGGQSSHLPLKLNTAGVIPPIFASSLLVFPATIAQFVEHPWAQAAAHWLLSRGDGLYNVLYVALIIFFCYFYTAVTFNTSDVAENMKKFGGFIPGIRPGQRTAEYIDRVLSRITLAGAIYVAVVCMLPTILIRAVQRALLLRRHGAADRRRRGARHRGADRDAHADPQLPGLHAARTAARTADELSAGAARSRSDARTQPALAARGTAQRACA